MKKSNGLLRAVALVSLCVSTMLPVGCTSQQVNSVVKNIDTYLPTALAILQDAITIYGAVGTPQTAGNPAASALATVQADLTAIQKPIQDYLAASAISGSTKQTAWTNIQALVDTATKDADALMQIAAVKNPNSQAAGIVVISSLDAAVHVIDGYVSSAQTPAQVAAKAQARTVKLKAVVQYWSAGDKQMVAEAAGVPFGVALKAAESRGF